MSEEGKTKDNLMKVCCNTSEEAIYMEIGSNRYQEYLKNLALLPKQTNAPSICTECWCFLTNSQMKKHRADHAQFRKTPTQYASEANFKALAKDKHIRSVGDSIHEIKVLFEKPLGSNQDKTADKSVSAKALKPPQKETEDQILKDNPHLNSQLDKQEDIFKPIFQHKNLSSTNHQSNKTHPQSQPSPRNDLSPYKKISVQENQKVEQEKCQTVPQED